MALASCCSVGYGVSQEGTGGPASAVIVGSAPDVRLQPHGIGQTDNSENSPPRTLLRQLDVSAVRKVVDSTTIAVVVQPCRETPTRPGCSGRLRAPGTVTTMARRSGRWPIDG